MYSVTNYYSTCCFLFVAGGIQVYSVAGGIQVYSVAIAPAASCYTATIKNYIKELSWTQHSNRNVP